jgi:hypothetical protein
MKIQLKRVHITHPFSGYIILSDGSRLKDQREYGIEKSIVKRKKIIKIDRKILLEANFFYVVYLTTLRAKIIFLRKGIFAVQALVPMDILRKSRNGFHK